MFARFTKALAVAALLAGGAASYGTIVNPTLTSFTNTNPFNVGVEANLVNNSGLSAAVNTGASLASAAAVTHVINGGFEQSWVTNANGGDYYVNGGVGINNPPTFVFDLGSSGSVDNIVLWQYQNNGGNGTSVGNRAYTVDLRFSASNSFSGPATTVTLDPNINSPSANAQVIGLTGAFGAQDARFVQMIVRDNAIDFPGITGGGDRVGLGEVRFDVSSPAAAPLLNLVTPVAITQTAGNTLGGFSAQNLINNSGLASVPTIDNYATVLHPTQTGATLWVTSTATFPNYYNGVNPNPQFVLDLGEEHQLVELVAWGYTDTNSNGAADFLVEFSTDGGATYYDSVRVAAGVFFGQTNVTLALGDVYGADTVRLTMLNNVAGAGRGLTTLPGGDRVGLGEIKFVAVNSIPEPATVSLLVLAGLATLRRRRAA